MELDRARILELVGMLKASSAAELAVQEKGVRVRLVRAVPGAVAGAETTVAAAGDGAAGASGGAGAVAAVPDPTVLTVTSRLVGLFYPGREPGGKPLVEVGQEVAEGQVLGIVEVLRKPMDVTSPAAGTLEQIVTEEGAPVQYGDPLFVIKP